MIEKRNKNYIDSLAVFGFFLGIFEIQLFCFALTDLLSLSRTVVKLLTTRFLKSRGKPYALINELYSMVA